MSKNLNKAIHGIMRDSIIRNPDIFKIENAVRPTKQFYVEKMKWWARKLGYEDYHVPIFLMLPFSLVALYQMASMYFIYGEKPAVASHGFYKDNFAIHFFYSAKTHPDSHFSSIDNLYTNDRLYGMMSLPKRPWEMFKDPENTIKRVAYRHNRENMEF